MISYCDELSNLTLPWVKEGFSHCFITTVTSSVLAGIALIFGGVQIYFFKRYATPLEFDQWQNVHSKRLYFMQFMLIFLAGLESVIRLILNGTLIGDKQIYGLVHSYFIDSVSLENCHSVTTA
jgi:ATP-binding cassette, subfamily B (MDR/TAP), member 6